MDNQKLTQSVARLIRAGSQHSKQTEKLRMAVDELVEYFAKVLPHSNEAIRLPDGYVFRWWPSREYQLIKSSGREELIQLRQGELGKSRHHLLNFAEDVANGWLDRVSAMLENEGARLEASARIIEEHCGLRP